MEEGEQIRDDVIVADEADSSENTLVLKYGSFSSVIEIVQWNVCCVIRISHTTEEQVR